MEDSESVTILHNEGFVSELQGLNKLNNSYTLEKGSQKT